VIISTKERHQRAAGGACAINSSANPARQIHISTDLEMQMSLCKLLRGVKRFSRCAQFVYLLGRDHLEMRHEKRVRAAVKFEAILSQKSEQIKRVSPSDISSCLRLIAESDCFSISPRAYVYLF